MAFENPEVVPHSFLWDEARLSIKVTVSIKRTIGTSVYALEVVRKVSLNGELGEEGEAGHG
jgi:hypothetical protein